MVESEGEGDHSIAEWRAGHDRYWQSEGRPALADDTELVWQRFRLVDPVARVHRVTAGDLGLPEGYRGLYSGKVRDLFEAPGGELLFVASDRISAYDWVLPTTIPDKGAILTRLSLWWFDQVADIVDSHVLPAEVPGAVADRAMLCRPLEMFPVECVARGYLTGSGLSEYRTTGSVCGVDLPPGLVDGSRLPTPIFTPATKAAIGDHDENVTFEVVAERLGDADAEQLRRLTLAVYERGAGIARERGIVLADTKLEFGRQQGDPAAPDPARRRGAHPRLLPVLARGVLAAREGWGPAVLRQAVRPGLADLTGVRLGPQRRRRASPAARRGRGPHARALRPGLRAADRAALALNRPIQPSRRGGRRE